MYSSLLSQNTQYIVTSQRLGKESCLFELALGLSSFEPFLLDVSVRRLPHVVVFNDTLQRFPR